MLLTLVNLLSSPDLILTEEQYEAIASHFNEPITEMGGIQLGTLLCLRDNFKHLQKFILLPDGRVNEARLNLLSSTFLNSLRETSFSEADPVSLEHINWQEACVYLASTRDEHGYEQTRYAYANLTTLVQLRNVHIGPPGSKILDPVSKLELKWVILLRDLSIPDLQRFFIEGRLVSEQPEIKSAIDTCSADIIRVQHNPWFLSLADQHPLSHLFEQQSLNPSLDNLIRPLVPEYLSLQNSNYVWSASSTSMRIALSHAKGETPRMPTQLLWEVLDASTSESFNSLIHCLIKNRLGIAVLQGIFNDSPILYKRFSSLILQNTHINLDLVCYHLSKTPSGIKLLGQILTAHSALIASISAKTLYTLEPAASAHEDLFVFYLLSRSLIGINLLSQIFTANPDLMAHITPEALCAVQDATAGADENTSTLYFLASTATGQALLDKIFTANPDLMAHITPEALCAVQDATAGADENASALYFLASTATGRVLLDKIFTANPDLMAYITPEALCALQNAAAGADENASTLYFLASTATGRVLLDKIFTANPDLMTHITPEALCALQNAAAGADENTSTLYFLASTATGQALLDKIFTANPDLMASIPPRVLIADVELSASGRTNIINLLKNSEGGQKILVKLANTNRDLCEVIMPHLSSTIFYSSSQNNSATGQYESRCIVN